LILFFDRIIKDRIVLFFWSSNDNIKVRPSIIRTVLQIAWPYLISSYEDCRNRKNPRSNTGPYKLLSRSRKSNMYIWLLKLDIKILKLKNKSSTVTSCLSHLRFKEFMLQEKRLNDITMWVDNLLETITAKLDCLRGQLYLPPFLKRWLGRWSTDYQSQLCDALTFSKVWISIAKAHWVW
jgi:hypothetical protein